MNPILHCLTTRRSIRKYSAEQISSEALENILEAACFAPSGANEQTWRFTAVQNTQILANLNLAIRDEALNIVIDDTSPMPQKNLNTRAKASNFAFHFNAPTLIIASNEQANPNAMADCACALQNMLLMAHALDLGACWINACHWLTHAPKVRTIYTDLGIPESHIACGSIIVGHRAEANLPTPLTRKEHTTCIIK